ncbi:MAG TPA: asparagine synthase-related protein [Thermoanaerobaculia bacterium]|nr:asparagine synthase-related protein [Thermoanaerobaculia bacterium]
MRGFHKAVDFAGEQEKGDICVLANARLDNRRELTASLSAWLYGTKGTPGDADLIRAAYLQWGESCPEKLLGDFSFSIWDPCRRRLFCASDPLGVRPLYYTLAGSRLEVASAIRPLLSTPGGTHRIDFVAVGNYLTKMTSEPERTFFEGLYRLPGGHTLTATPESLRVRRYWDVAELSALALDEEETASRFRELLTQAVRDRLDTPEGSVGIAMSGGLDSTSVAALAAGAGPLRAYSFVFDQLDECDERVFISSLSRDLGIETTFIEAERFWFLGDAEAYPPPLETPEVSWDFAFRQMLQALRERGGRVLLTGHGADDLLLGSKRVYAERLRRGDLRVLGEVWQHSRSRRYGWRPFYHLLAEPLIGPSAASALRRLFSRREPFRLPAWIAPDFADRTALSERLAEYVRGPAQGSARDEMYQNLIARPSYHRSIDWYDRNAGPFGVEVRHPFLDRRLFEFVFALPPEHLMRLEERKLLLRRAVAGILPDAVRLRRRKTSLGGFVDFSLRKEADRIRNLLAAPLSAELGIIEGSAACQAYERYCAGETAPGQRSLWYVITLELWLRQYLGQFNVEQGGADSARKAA